jgi:hypothetical protein
MLCLAKDLPRKAGEMDIRIVMMNFPLAGFQPMPPFPPNYITETFQYLQIEMLGDILTFWCILMVHSIRVV